MPLENTKCTVCQQFVKNREGEKITFREVLIHCFLCFRPRGNFVFCTKSQNDLRSVTLVQIQAIIPVLTLWQEIIASVGFIFLSLPYIAPPLSRPASNERCWTTGEGFLLTIWVEFPLPLYSMTTLANLFFLCSNPDKYFFPRQRLLISKNVNKPRTRLLLRS